LVERHYLRTLPFDPVADSSEAWILQSPADGQAGVYNLNSGAEGADSEGVPYAEW
jgi:general secretion pathway protein G